jgi:hypothetical protein
MTSKIAIEWETNDGETEGYTEDGRTITISARVPYRAGYQAESNLRHWTVTDTNGNTVARGEADGLRAAKKAAVAAI